MTTTKRPVRELDRKLAKIKSGKYKPTDFIIADAKDADMAFGLQAPATYTGKDFGSSGPGIYRTRQEYIAQMQALIDQGQLDIMLTSVSNAEALAKKPGNSRKITLGFRGNDASDIWSQRGTRYPATKSLPFSSVNLKKVKKFSDLALYSLTFNNDVESDLRTLEDYKRFRIEAAELGIRHFMEVFNPNAPVNLRENDYGSFVNDHIIRTLAGVTEEERPLFLKVAYNGFDNLRELSEHDSSLTVGILGGSSGTTRDTFELLHRAEQAGSRVAIFGRKIQRAESQTDIVRLFRPVIEGKLTPEQAVEDYHAALAKKQISSIRSLTADLKITDKILLGE
jgi:DhnA family fructose-bisphosphate aldolase class Ia